MRVHRFLRTGALLSLASCLDPTQVELLIHTTAACGPGGGPILNETGILASDKAALAGAPQAVQVGCADPGSASANVGTMVVYPRGGSGEASVLIVGGLDGQSVEGCLAALANATDVSGCIFARRRIAFIEHASLRLGVTLDPACAGTVCDENSTCSVGPSGPRCVSSAVECQGTDCDIQEPQGGGGAGAGGAGTGGGGGGPMARLEWLTKPIGPPDVRTTDVSDDGSVVVGFAGGAMEPIPVAWRNQVLLSGPGANGIEGGPGRILRACGNGGRVVGSLGGGSPTGTVWHYTAGQGYRTEWVSPPGTQFFDCDAEGTRQYGLSNAMTAMFASGVLQATLPGYRATTCDRDCEIGIADPISPTGEPALVSINASMLTVQGDLEAMGGECPAMDRRANLVACRVPSAEAVRIFNMTNPAPIYQQQNDFTPLDIAVLDGTEQYLAVGTCSGGGQRACVLVDGAGPFELDATSQRPWARTQHINFEGKIPVALTGISVDRKTIVGYATAPGSGTDPFIIYLDE